MSYWSQTSEMGTFSIKCLRIMFTFSLAENFLRLVFIAFPSKNIESNKISGNVQFRLKHYTVSTLATVFKNQAEDILRLAQGIDDREVETAHETKSISAEETFSTDIGDKEVLLSVLHAQVEEVAQRLRAEKLQCRTITLKLRYGDFRTITRSSTFEATNTTKVLLTQAQQVFNQWHKKSAGALRLLGFGASGLSPEGSGQKLLFSNPEDEKQKKIDEVYDKIRGKFGDDALKRG
jgi:DNA polymerase-4